MTKKKKTPDYLSSVNARRSVKQYLDFDYLDELKQDPKATAWLNKFVKEFYHGHFDRNGDNLHPDDKRKDCYAGNNARHRDLFNRGERVSGDPAATEDDDATKEDEEQ